MYYLRNLYMTRIAAMITLDFLCLVSAASITWFYLKPEIPAYAYIVFTLLGASLGFVSFWFTDAYRPRVASNGRAGLISMVNALGLTSLAFLGFYFFSNLSTEISPVIAHTAGFYLPLLLLTRASTRAYWRSRWGTQSVLILGTSDLGLRIADILVENEAIGIRLAGFLSGEMAYHQHAVSFEGHAVLGEPEHLEKILESTRIDLIIVASKNRGEHLPTGSLQRAKLAGVRVESGVAFMERLTGMIYHRDLRPSYLIFANHRPPGALSEAVKRGLDFVGAAIGLALASPLLLISGIAIRLDSKGPILFKQTRSGQHGRPFTMFKLRSMTVDAEKESGAVFACKGDSRVTRVGKILRPLRLDEIPQLWNVLVGDMSLVGPRAERPEFIEELAGQYRFFWIRSTVKPGLSGWAQIRFGYVNDVEAYESKLALDLYYVLHRSYFMDAAILLQTVKTVLYFRGL